MITNYYRPQNIEEALKLLSEPDTHPLGGGTKLNQASAGKFSVVDLQALGLNQIRKAGNNLEIDACVTLQQLLESAEIHPSIKQAVQLEAGLNIRNSATVAGVLVTSDGRSAFATVMLALDARITTVGINETNSMGLGEFLPLRPQVLITSVSIPLNVKSAFETVGRTPLDKPIVCAAVTRWTSGRTRLALGGYHQTPVLAMDGTESDGLEVAARSAFHESGDEWASSEYRSDVAATLAKRCLAAVSK
jgi:CO/xanthine dehydrogenase FAD-binding subunit